MATTKKKAPAKKVVKRPQGRKPIYDQTAHKAAIIELLSKGESLRSYTAISGNPSHSTVMDWLSADAAFADQYTRAREVGAEAIFEGLDDVSEAAVRAESAVEIAGLRLKSDNIKWKLGKMAPKKYGDRLNVDATVETKVTGDSELIAELAKLGVKVATVDPAT